jgi:hypothetical protein
MGAKPIASVDIHFPARIFASHQKVIVNALNVLERAEEILLPKRDKLPEYRPVARVEDSALRRIASTDTSSRQRIHTRGSIHPLGMP